MQESATRLREKIKSSGFPVMSEEELERYNSLTKDARIIGFKRITADLFKRSGMVAERKAKGSFSKEQQVGKKGKK